MSGVTDADRERAADWIESVLDNWVGAFDHSNDEARDRVYVLTELAAALAEERQKARAPFLALVTEYAGGALSEHFGGHTTAGEILRDIRSIAEADA